MSDVSDVRLRKAELRAQVLARRSALPADQRSAAGTLIRDAVLAEPQVQMAGTIAAYYSIGAEPGTHGLVFALWKRGSYVLLPVLRPDGDLDWASYEGPDSMVPGPRGPAGEYLGAQFGLAPLDIGHVTHRTCGQEHLQEFASVQAWLIPPPPLRT